ncbi:MAG: hypothetical protein GY739_12495, partial [Mesoflavibacter sp.]|nr:hypothetical protein [Mesoflavibacter sp.]
MWKKNSNSKQNDEGNIVKDIHTQQMVEMHDLSGNYKVEPIEMKSIGFGEIEPNDIDKGNELLHETITPNGVTVKGHVADKNTESDESQQDEDLYSDVADNTQEILTPQYETTEGNDTYEDKPDDVEDMCKETDI